MLEIILLFIHFKQIISIFYESFSLRFKVSLHRVHQYPRLDAVLAEYLGQTDLTVMNE